MSEITIDIVLLPSDAMTEMAIEANRQLVTGQSQELVLSKDGCLPHISLAMGCINVEKIGEIEHLLQNITNRHFPRQLKAVGVYIGTSEDGQKTSLYYIQKTEAIQELHEAIMTQLAHYLGEEVTEDMLVTPPAIHQSTLQWIQHYRSYSSFEYFMPHITIGFGVADPLDRPVDCTPLKLAICHLGNHCTCRKVLALIEPQA